MFLLRLQLLRIPADAKAVTEIAVFHIADKAVFGMYAVNGNLLASPVFVFDIRNGDGHFYKLLFPYGQIGVIAHRVCLPRLDFQIALVDGVHNVFGNGFDVFFCHSFYLNVISLPNSSSRTASAFV